MNSSNDLKDQLSQQIIQAVASRLGRNDPQISRLIEDEVNLAVGSGNADGLFAEARREPNPVAPDRIVITANGRNGTGIIAKLAQIIYEFDGDIQDMNQTLVGGYFTMILVVDISGATTKGSRFINLKERLKREGESMGLHVVDFHDDILTTMHAV